MNIKNWKDLKVGDNIKCLMVCNGCECDDFECDCVGVEMSKEDEKYHGVECIVTGFTEHGRNHILTNLTEHGYYIEKFEFVSRP